MFVDRHEDWQAGGGEMSHVMGQIASLVLDGHRHPQPGRKGGAPAALPQHLTEPGAARKAAGFAAHAQVPPLTRLRVGRGHLPCMNALWPLAAGCRLQ